MRPRIRSSVPSPEQATYIRGSSKWQGALDIGTTTAPGLSTWTNARAGVGESAPRRGPGGSGEPSGTIGWVNLLRPSRGVLLLALATVLVGHHHHHHHLQSVGMVGLALGAFASWVGVPGPGEPLLIAAAVLAARGKLALDVVLITAFLAATLGGIVGWLAGIKGGRALMARPGPLLRLRLRALERGEEVFQRAPALSVLLAPSFVCGIHHVRAALYLPLNAASAVLWTLGIGLGAYFVGPPVVDLVDDAGTALLIGFVLLVVVGVLIGVFARRRSRKARAEARARSGPSRPTGTEPPADRR